MLVIGIVRTPRSRLNKRAGSSIVCNSFGLARLETEISKLHGYDSNISNEKSHCDTETGEGAFHCSSIKKCCNILGVHWKKEEPSKSDSSGIYNHARSQIKSIFGQVSNKLGNNVPAVVCQPCHTQQIQNSREAVDFVKLLLLLGKDVDMKSVSEDRLH